MCELHARLKSVGQVQSNAFDWPLTQNDLVDALDLATVHADRTLQTMRHDKLVEITKRKRTTLSNLEGLREAAGFDPRYRLATRVS